MKKLNIIIFTLLFFVFCLKGVSVDPDFGWHMRTGAYILAYGIPQTDPFSYSMPRYHFVDHEWLTDVLTVGLYPFMGGVGLAILAALFALFALFLQVHRKDKLLFLPLLLSGAAFFPFIGFRPQVISWLFFSLLLFILRQKKYWAKTRFSLPLLFFLWANIHGSFILGLCILVIFLFVAVLQTKKIAWGDSSIVIVCILVTLINPYGVGLWQEAFITLSRPEVHFIITEWLPLVLFAYIPLWLLVVLSGVVVFRYRNKYSLLEKILFLFLFALGMGGVRNIPYWVIFSLPLTVRGFGYLHAEAGKEGGMRLMKALGILSMFALGSIVVQNTFSFQRHIFPQQAVKYLRAHMPVGNVFTDFNWGGYFLWQLPEKKVFVDGRMSSWRQASQQKNESMDAFREFYWVANRVESIDELSAKYAIDTLVLSPVPFEDWQQQDIDLFAVNEKKKFPPIRQQLQSGGWKIVYQDQTTIIYQRK